MVFLVVVYLYHGPVTKTVIFFFMNFFQKTKILQKTFSCFHLLIKNSTTFQSFQRFFISIFFLIFYVKSPFFLHFPQKCNH